MKILKLMLLLFSTSAFCAQDGTGNEPKSAKPHQTDYCLISVKAQDGTGNDKTKDSAALLDAYMNYLKCILSNKAQDGTGN